MWTWLLIVPFLLSLSHVSLGEDRGQQIFDRCLLRISRDQPVAGEFEIQASTSEVAHRQYLESAHADAAARGLGLIAAPAQVTKSVRWAWDGDREMLESGPQEKSFESFFSTPESFLDGMVAKNYNLTGPKNAYPVRPASFYFLVGTMKWSEVSEGATAALETTPPDDAPAGTQALMITHPAKPHRVRLYVRTEDDRPAGLDLILEDRVFHRLRVSDFLVHPDGRAFPRFGRLEVFQPGTGNLLKADELHARRIDFPKDEQELQAAFAMQIPVGSEVHDLLLNKEYVVETPTDAQTLMGLDRSPKWKPMDQSTTPGLRPPPAAAPSRRYWMWANVGVLAVISVYFMVRAARRGVRKP